MISISILNLQKPIFSIPKNPQELTRSNHHDQHPPMGNMLAFFQILEISHLSFRHFLLLSQVLPGVFQLRRLRCGHEVGPKKVRHLRSSKDFQIFLALDTLDGNWQPWRSGYGWTSGWTPSVKDHKLWTSPSVNPKRRGSLGFGNLEPLGYPLVN